MRASIHTVLALNHSSGPSCFKSNDYFDNYYFRPVLLVQGGVLVQVVLLLTGRLLDDQFVKRKV